MDNFSGITDKGQLIRNKQASASERVAFLQHFFPYYNIILSHNNNLVKYFLAFILNYFNELSPLCVVRCVIDRHQWFIVGDQWSRDDGYLMVKKF